MKNLHMKSHSLLMLPVILLISTPTQGQSSSADSSSPGNTALRSPWARLVTEDGPELWWRFEGEQPLSVRTGGPAGTLLPPASHSGVQAGADGVSPNASRLFRPGSGAASFNGKNSVLRFKDPGPGSPFDFDRGQALTIEAWIRLNGRPTGFVHILSKGRTGNPGFPAGNQNYAFRIDGGKGDPRLSFLFRNREDKVKQGNDFHRWTSDDSFVADGQWHHVAIVYRFGHSDSLRGYIDGQPTTGQWDLKGATSKAPIVDDDELWVGSAMGGNPASTFKGLIDEIVVYRKALSADRFALRVPFVRRPQPPPVPHTASPRNNVLVEVIEGISDRAAWPSELPASREHYYEPAFAFFEIPPRYNARGLRSDRANPLILKASSRIRFAPGKYRLLLRTLRFGRVYLDGKKVLETPQRGHRGGGHNAMYDLDSHLVPGSRQLYPGAVEKLTTLQLAGEHEIRVELFAGGQGRRAELGESSLSVSPQNPKTPKIRKS